ncbi:MAG TPA: ZIP family metal transporter [Burkholderiales bacterium]|jgi:zinc and cadmium transporter|nr:ZIP family metal transporter [Burkholderiales bacterium]
MTTLAWILTATIAGGLLSVAAAAALALNARASQVPILISYAVGTLLGAVFLELLPQAFGMSDNLESLAGVILAGLLLFFVLEKLVLWRHCHQEECEGHVPQAVAAGDHGRSGAVIIIGDTFHNLVDGVLIAAAFLANHNLGVVTALAIIAHEIPQEVSDFLILLHSGYTKARALLLNVVSSAAMVAGGVIAYFALQTMQQWIAPLLGIAIASMLYVAVADLIPGLHRRPELLATVQQVVMIALGVGTIWLVGDLAHAHAGPR